MQQKIQQFQEQLQQELNNILQYWMQYSMDEINGGFYGSVTNDNIPNAYAPKGVVLNARILWTFSAAYNLEKKPEYLIVADRAMQYIIHYFFDKSFGGVYWSVDTQGNMQDGKKQIYGLAFCIYGLSEYYASTKNKEALDRAVDLYNCIEKYSYDLQYEGYFEAFTREWQIPGDLRLSAKDANEKKTMNTHLHIIEAYANLYKVWPDELLKNKIAALLLLFDDHFINHNTYHLRLFFDEEWHEKVDVISYGHDIEAAWLLLQCAQIIGHEAGIKKFRILSIKITNAAMRGLDADGGLWYEYEQNTHHLIREKHWWPQAEAIVGFYNAYELSHDEIYLELALKSWEFTQQHILDKTNGEWFWGVNEDYTVMQNQDKAGFWKCPYHNSRACIEIIKRLNT